MTDGQFLNRPYFGGGKPTTDEDILRAHAAHSMESAYRAGLAEGFRRGVEAAAELVESWTRTHPKEWAAAQIRALRPEGDK